MESNNTGSEADLRNIHERFENTEATEPPEDTPLVSSSSSTTEPLKPDPPKSAALLKLEHMAIFNAAMMANSGIAGVHCLVYNLTHDETEVDWTACELSREDVELIVNEDLPEDAKKFLLEWFPPWMTSIINIEKKFIQRMDAAAKPKGKKEPPKTT